MSDDNTLWDSKTTFRFEEVFANSLVDSLDGDVDRNIEAVTADVDRGVQCWQTFLEILQERFPNVKNLLVSQNYSYHSEDCCDVKNHKKDMKDEVLEAFQRSSLQRLWINDCQTDFTFMKKDQVKMTVTFEGDRRLIIYRSDYLCDSEFSQEPKDFEITIAEILNNK